MGQSHRSQYTRPREHRLTVRAPQSKRSRARGGREAGAQAMKCITCYRDTPIGDKCAMCLLKSSEAELTQTLLDIVRPVDMSQWPNPYDVETRVQDEPDSKYR